MIKEAYVSFEVAKLLKEKGFEIDTSEDYWKIGEDGTMYFMCSIGAYTSDIKNKSAFYRPADSYPCPTQQMACEWLRQEHHLSVEVYRTACGWIGCVVAIPSGTDLKFLEEDGDDLPSGQYTTHAKACEATIKYCLENLI